MFAELSGDHSEIHMNAESAKANSFGARIAHGALIFSISIGLTTQSGLLDESLIAFYGVEGLRFTKPVFIGDTVTVQKRVEALDDKGAGRGLVTFDTRVLNQHAALVLRYRDSLLVKKRA
jgi:acyl dehydratase